MEEKDNGGRLEPLEHGNNGYEEQEQVNEEESVTRKMLDRMNRDNGWRRVRYSPPPPSPPPPPPDSTPSLPLQDGG